MQNLFVDEAGNLKLIDNEICLAYAWGHCAYDSVLIPTTQKQVRTWWGAHTHAGCSDWCMWGPLQKGIRILHLCNMFASNVPPFMHRSRSFQSLQKVLVGCLVSLK